MVPSSVLGQTLRHNSFTWPLDSGRYWYQSRRRWYDGVSSVTCTNDCDPIDTDATDGHGLSAANDAAYDGPANEYGLCLAYGYWSFTDELRIGSAPDGLPTTDGLCSNNASTYGLSTAATYGLSSTANAAWLWTADDRIPTATDGRVSSTINVRPTTVLRTTLRI